MSQEKIVAALQELAEESTGDSPRQMDSFSTYSINC
jgi:hypothetical protein